MLIRALRDAGDFKLIEFVDADGAVQLTAAGSRTATVLNERRIRESAAKLLTADK